MKKCTEQRVDQETDRTIYLNEKKGLFRPRGRQKEGSCMLHINCLGKSSTSRILTIPNINIKKGLSKNVQTSSEKLSIEIGTEQL